MKNKRISAAKKELRHDKFYSLENALGFFCDSYAEKFQAKFDESVEFTLKLSIDPLKSDQMVRGTVVMPHGLGKAVRVMAIVDDSDVEAAIAAGADFAGNEDMIEKIQDGFTDFDVCVATPGMMPKISKVAKKLGPKGLMPNPKSGSVTTEFSKAIEVFKRGCVEFKSDKNALIHTTVGKISSGAIKIKENITALYRAILDAKPEKSKGDLVIRCSICSSQGPSLKLDLKSIIV
tara:strand:- start:98 stop:799 length:702 start_codon:yes stop_codon:yes gene_type:complete